jgi:hypothetical protein
VKAYTTREAAEHLGLTRSQVRSRILSGELKSRRVKANRGQGYEYRVYLNGNEAEATPEISDPLVEIGDELIKLGRKLKRAVKAHDDRVRQEAITEFATTLAETVQKGR